MSSKLQQIILPRNWLFGRLSYVRNNLNNILNVNSKNFTEKEKHLLRVANDHLEIVINNKSVGNKLLKHELQQNNISRPVKK